MGFFLSSLGFPGQLPYPSSLGLMGLPSTHYFLCLHYFGFTVAHSHFSTSYTTHGFAIPLFLGYIKPVCFLKAHLSISWTYDPLFLPLGFNGFFYQFTNSFLPVVLGFFFLFGFLKWSSTFSPLNIWSVPAVHMWMKDFPTLSISFPSFPSRVFLNSRPHRIHMCVYIYIYIFFFFL